MSDLPVLTIGDISYVPNGKPVIVIFPDGDGVEFETVQGATTYLENQKINGRNEAHFARIFKFENEWTAVNPAPR